MGDVFFLKTFSFLIDLREGGGEGKREREHRCERTWGMSSYFSDSCGDPGFHDTCHRLYYYSRARGDPKAPSRSQLNY